MRAAVSTAAEPWLVVEDVADPIPEPGDLILRVDACGICGSDLHMAHSLKDSPGIVFGHEFAGTVVEMGTDVVDYQVGDRVVGFPLVGRQRELIGAQRPGAFAEFVAVGAAESFRLPEELTADLGALVEPMAVAHHALSATPRELGEPVLILGAGPVGLAVLLWAQSFGARHVVVSDPAPDRRALAAALGATAVDPIGQDVGRAFADVAGARPRAIVECVGRPGMIQQAVEAAGHHAHVTIVGACTAPETFHPIVATMKELTLRFVVYYQRSDFAQTLEAMRTGRLDPSPLITGRIGLDELPTRFTALMAPSPDCKVLINP